jgi:hypothetical protein
VRVAAVQLGVEQIDDEAVEVVEAEGRGVAEVVDEPALIFYFILCVFVFPIQILPIVCLQ